MVGTLGDGHAGVAAGLCDGDFLLQSPVGGEGDGGGAVAHGSVLVGGDDQCSVAVALQGLHGQFRSEVSSIEVHCPCAVGIDGYVLAFFVGTQHDVAAFHDEDLLGGTGFGLFVGLTGCE